MKSGRIPLAGLLLFALFASVQKVEAQIDLRLIGIWEYINPSWRDHNTLVLLANGTYAHFYCNGVAIMGVGAMASFGTWSIENRKIGFREESPQRGYPPAWEEYKFVGGQQNQIRIGAKEIGYSEYRRVTQPTTEFYGMYLAPNQEQKECATYGGCHSKEDFVISLLYRFGHVYIVNAVNNNGTYWVTENIASPIAALSPGESKEYIVNGVRIVFENKDNDLWCTGSRIAP